MSYENLYRAAWVMLLVSVSLIATVLLSVSAGY